MVGRGIDIMFGGNLEFMVFVEVDLRDDENFLEVFVKY